MSNFTILPTDLISRAVASSGVPTEEELKKPDPEYSKAKAEIEKNSRHDWFGMD